jgi:hypothetical protein
VYARLRNSFNTPLFVATGFGLGSLVQWLFLLSWNVGPAIISMGVVGAIGGSFLAYRSAPRRSVIPGAVSYSLGLLSGGAVSVVTLMNFLDTKSDPSLPFHYFYPLFIFGFGIAGATSAALIRPRLIPVTTSAVCFLIGGSAGGAAVGVLFGTPLSRPNIAGMGLLITDIVIGAVSGRALEFSDASIQ